MLATLNDVLIPARKGKYGVGLFNAVNLELARGILEAAEETRSPVIYGTAEVLFPYGPLDVISNFLIPMAKKASVPVVVHLDHGLRKETCLEALKLGFTSIMFDGSAYPYEENVARTKEMSDIAHSYGASIEAELGHVGTLESKDDPNLLADPTKLYTDPLQAKDFVAKTGVDALAIAVGTAHGAYKLPPKLDFERIRTIRNTVDIPLVLHGGSGLTDNDFKKAIAEGISKVNIFTDINIAAVEAEFSAFDSMSKGIIELIPAAVNAVKLEVTKKMKLFGSCNQGNLAGKGSMNEELVRKIVAQVMLQMK